MLLGGIFPISRLDSRQDDFRRWREHTLDLRLPVLDAESHEKDLGPRESVQCEGNLLFPPL